MKNEKFVHRFTEKRVNFNTNIYLKFETYSNISLNLCKSNHYNHT